MAQKNDQPPASPTLIPALPSPIPPTTSSAATSEELSFFDRAKKSISNKNTFNEFLKLCNLFSQDLVDRTVLVHRARSFIGTNPELMKWFQDFIGYDEKDVIVENKARIPGGRVSLSNCRGLGPSYRLLPKRVCCLFFFFSLSCVSIVLGDVRWLGLDPLFGLAPSALQ
jgi:paired amphipathic helix protein Sin3a